MSHEGVARIELAVADGVAVIRLTRAERMNAFDEALHVEMREALATIGQNESVRALILTGSGRAFSAGQDLGERAVAFQRGDWPDLGASLDQNYNPLVSAICELPIPVIAAVNGIAFGAGAALAIACDLVLASASARFQFGFINVGLGPDSGASWFLPRLVGLARASDLMLTGRRVQADEALAMGLISRVIPDDELMPTAMAVAAELAARSPEAVSAIKRQLRTNSLGALPAALATERDTQALLGRTENYRQAVLDFFTRKG